MNTFMSLSKLKKLDNFHLEKLNSNKNQFNIFLNIYGFFNTCFIFESLSGPKELAETSIIGFDPPLTIQCNSKNFILLNKKQKIIKVSKVTEPLTQLRSILPKITQTHIKYRYIGGAVGYVSYEAIRFWEKLPKLKKKILNFPLFEFGIYTDGILYDHKENQAYYFHIGLESQIDEINKILNNDSHPFNANTELNGKNSHHSKNLNLKHIKCSVPQRNLSKAEFIKMVKKAQ